MDDKTHLKQPKTEPGTPFRAARGTPLSAEERAVMTELMAPYGGDQAPSRYHLNTFGAQFVARTGRIMRADQLGSQLRAHIGGYAPAPRTLNRRAAPGPRPRADGGHAVNRRTWAAIREECAAAAI